MDFAVPPETQLFVEAARHFAESRVAGLAATIDQANVYPRQTVREAAAAGLLGITVDPSWGGGGRDNLSYVLAVEAVAQVSATMAVILVVSNSLVAEPLEEFGSDTQKQAWLRRLVTGDALGAFALTEAQSGSDAASQRSTATHEGNRFILNGRKVWVANAETADVAIVFAVTDRGTDGEGISAFLVRLDAPGVSRVTADSLGVRGLGCVDLTFTDVTLGTDALLGERGRGFRLAQRALEGGRIAIAAQALGVGQAALEMALEYARTREAFGHPIGEFQAIQFQLADLATDLEAARMLMWQAADQRGQGIRASMSAAMAKLQASEAAHRAADRAMQILASEGYRRGSTIERLFRDARAAEIYQGTSEVQRMIIAQHLLGDRRSSTHPG